MKTSRRSRQLARMKDNAIGRKRNMARVRITRGNIAKATTEAIVNAANNGLHEGAGVCGAIFGAVRRAGGHAQLTAACRKIRHCPTGDAVITPSFGLEAPWIIHAVGPVWRGPGHVLPGALDATAVAQLRELADAYRAVLRVCRDNGVRSVTIPGISTGIYGLPKELGSAVAVSVCGAEAGDIEVDLVAYDEDSFTVLQAAPSAQALDLLADTGILD